MSQTLKRAVQNIDLKKVNRLKEQFNLAYMSIPKTDPWVPISLVVHSPEGSTLMSFKLEFSWKAAQLIQRELGVNIFAGELTEKHMGDMDILFKVLLAGLSLHQPTMTAEALEGMLTVRHSVYYVQVVSKALEVIQPDVDQLESLIGELPADEESDDLEAGDTTAPLPEIVPSPTSGEAAESLE